MQSIDVSDLPEPYVRAVKAVVETFSRELAERPAPRKEPAERVKLSLCDGEVVDDLSREEIHIAHPSQSPTGIQNDPVAGANIDSSRVEELRALARQGGSVADMVHSLRSSLGPAEDSIIKILIYFKYAFNLTLREARAIEGADCMGNEALSDDELDSALRPLIMERLPAP